MWTNSHKNLRQKLLYELLYLNQKRVFFMDFWGILRSIKTLRKPLNHAY